MTKEKRLQRRAFIALAAAGLFLMGCAGHSKTHKRTIVYNDVSFEGEPGYRIEVVETRTSIPNPKPTHPTARLFNQPVIGPITITSPDGTKTVLENGDPGFSDIHSSLAAAPFDANDPGGSHNPSPSANIPFAAPAVISPD